MNEINCQFYKSNFILMVHHPLLNSEKHMTFSGRPRNCRFEVRTNRNECQDMGRRNIKFAYHFYHFWVPWLANVYCLRSLISPWGPRLRTLPSSWKTKTSWVVQERTLQCYIMVLVIWNLRLYDGASKMESRLNDGANDMDSKIIWWCY